MRRQLASVERYVVSIRMSISLSNCVGFAVEKRGEAWAATPVALFTGDSAIRFLGVNEPFTYLGLT